MAGENASQFHDPNAGLTLFWLQEHYAICRLAGDSPLPMWIAEILQRPTSGGMLSITRTDDELSIVAPQTIIPTGVHAEQDWAAMRIVGQLDFDQVGILTQLTAALAAQQIPVFALSTFDTDYLLVRATHRTAAECALVAAGMRFVG